MIQYIAGLFRDDKPQSMGRVLSFLITITGIILLFQVPPEDRMAAGLTALGLGVGGKTLSKGAEAIHTRKDI